MKAIALYSPTYQKKYHVFYYTIFGNYYSLIHPQLQNMIVLKFHLELFYLILIQKIGSEQLDTSDSLSAGKNTPHPFQELKDEFEPDQDKNLTSPDKLTPPLQGKETDLLNQDFNDFTLDKPGQSHDNPDPGTDPDETALMNKLQQLSKDDLHDDLLELENESFPVEVTEGTSDESDQENEGSNNESEPNISEPTTNSMGLRSEKKVHFKH